LRAIFGVLFVGIDKCLFCCIIAGQPLCVKPLVARRRKERDGPYIDRPDMGEEPKEWGVATLGLNRKNTAQRGEI